MSIVSIFTREAPTIAGYSFDAVLEDNFEATVTLPSYVIEAGVRVVNHRILNPFMWSLTGAVSNNPLKTQLTDFIGGGLSNLIDNPLVAAVAGMSAGFLAGSDETRASTTLSFLLELMQYGEPFDIDAGDILLKNMAITKLSRTKDASNEQGMIFVAQLQEVITLDRVEGRLQPSQDQLRDEDPAKSAIARIVDRGQVMAKEVNEAAEKAVNSVLDGIF
jgi:hypothetical protein